MSYSNRTLAGAKRPLCSSSGKAFGLSLANWAPKSRMYRRTVRHRQRALAARNAGTGEAIVCAAGLTRWADSGEGMATSLTRA